LKEGSVSFKIVDLNSWRKLGVAAPGRNEKYWFVNHLGEEWLFKIPKVGTTEHVSEKLAYEIAQLVGIEAAETEFATYKGRLGTVSKNFVEVDKGENLIEMLDLIQKMQPGYDPELMKDTWTGREYSLELVIDVIRATKEALITYVMQYLIFDALIGNSDRHHGNWGIIYSAFRETRMAPSYDHSASLGSKIREEDIENILNDRRRFMANVETKAKSLLVFSGKRKVTQKELLIHIRDNFADGELVRTILGMTSKIDRTNVNAIIDRVPFEILSRRKKDFLLELIIAKRQLVEEVFA